MPQQFENNDQVCQIPKPSMGLLLLGLCLKGQVNSVTLHACDSTTSCDSSSVTALPGPARSRLHERTYAYA